MRFIKALVISYLLIQAGVILVVIAVDRGGEVLPLVIGASWILLAVTIPIAEWHRYKTRSAADPSYWYRS